jgi:hypothetical protein
MATQDQLLCRIYQTRQVGPAAMPLFCIREGLGPNLTPNSGCPDNDLLWISSVHLGKCPNSTSISPGSHLLNNFQFIIH